MDGEGVFCRAGMVLLIVSSKANMINNLLFNILRVGYRFAVLVTLCCLLRVNSRRLKALWCLHI